jgi:anhydro-N-acetylmuramic acid kinase
MQKDHENMKNKNTFRVIGLMSGTSLDGLDIAFCVFKKNNSGWTYQIEKATTLRYPKSWQTQLANAHTLSGEDLLALDSKYGSLLGKAVLDFIRKYDLNPDFIASHGHTIFHQPSKGFTYQLGNGNAIHAVCGIPVVYDFRTLDVMLGGEGAPLVPAGDKFLFQDHDVCLNLGGIANLSTDVKKQRIAYDICFCNMPLNYLAAKTGREIDRGGIMASEGEVNSLLLQKLTKANNALKKKRPSLGREIFEKQFRALLDQEDISVKDRLRTCVESTATEIMEAILLSKKNATVLCTGGGAFNSFLVARMLEHAGDNASLIIPDEDVVKFKEALVFAFLGVLRVRGEVNCLKSVTHAQRNNSGGVLTGFKI